jgi:3-oxoacyl-[acyl-carrier-protein] synthase-3
MGTKINMVAVSTSFLMFCSAGSISLSVAAAKHCLRDSGINPCDLGLLINTGIYRFKNTGEPAIAAIIQKKIGVNSTNSFAADIDYSDCKTTFSFDLNNGGCSWLTGIEILNGFIQTGKIDCGMLVTGDAEPFRGFSENFNYKAAAAAIILSKSDDSGGFALFRTYSFPEYNRELISNTYYGHVNGSRGKKNILSVRQKETYPELCIDCAVESLNKFMNEAGISINETDLIIPSQSPASFTSGMKKQIGMNNRFVEIKKPGKKEFHTAGAVFALKKVWDENRFKTAKNIIFLTVGSGISVSVALYRNQ